MALPNRAVERATREHRRAEDRRSPQRRAELIGPAPSNLVSRLLNDSSTSAIPSFFRGPNCNWRLALRCDESPMTSPEAQVR